MRFKYVKKVILTLLIFVMIFGNHKQTIASAVINNIPPKISLAEEIARQESKEAEEKAIQESIEAEEIRKQESIKAELAKMKKGNVYLTFDDGPGKYTDKFLELFDKYNVKVTYFVTYDNEYRRKRIKDVYDHGHTIGVHSYQHKPELIYISEEAYKTDLAQILQVVKDVTGKDTRYVRFPFGSSNTMSKSYSKGIMAKLTKFLTDSGYEYYDWNVYGDDAKSSNEDPNNIFQKTVAQLEALGTHDAVVLCHDTNLHTYKYMELLIPYLLANNYTIRPIDDNAPTCHHKVLN